MKYTTEEERKQARREYAKQRYQTNKEKKAEYYQANKEKILEQHKQWYEANKEKRVDYMKQYRKTPMGRALYLVQSHNQKDKKYNRGECTLTAKWVVDHIFSQKCIYCGESWAVIELITPNHIQKITLSLVARLATTKERKNLLKSF